MTATSTLNQRRPFYLANPVMGQYYGSVDAYVTDGTQRYNALLLSISRRAVRGATLSANYTLSHCYGSPDGSGGGTANLATGYNDPNDPHFDDGNCTADRLHNFTATAGIQSPRFDSATWRAIASDWRLVGSFRAITGPWVTILTGTDVALNGQSGTQRVNQMLDDPYGDKSTNPVNGGIRWLNPLAFAQPAPGTLGTMPRNIVRGPGSKNVDMAVSRVIRLTGTQDIEVRAEAFNVFNWQQWTIPPGNLNLSSPNFGLITQVVNNSQRILQFAVKYMF
jgi:hypothetical protein